MTNNRVLVIGNYEIMNSVVKTLIPDKKYTIVPYYNLTNEHFRGARRFSEFSAEGVQDHIRRHGDQYNAVIINQSEMDAFIALTESGFSKPIIPIQTSGGPNSTYGPVKNLKAVLDSALMLDSNLRN